MVANAVLAGSSISSTAASLVETHYLSGVRRYRTLKSDLVEIRQGGFDIILIRTYPVEWE